MLDTPPISTIRARHTATIHRPSDSFDFEGGFPVAAKIQCNKWVEAEGLNVDQTLLESYAVGPETESDPAKWVTELYRPLNG